MSQTLNPNHCLPSTLWQVTEVQMIMCGPPHVTGFLHSAHLQDSPNLSQVSLHLSWHRLTPYSQTTFYWYIHLPLGHCDCFPLLATMKKWKSWCLRANFCCDVFLSLRYTTRKRTGFSLLENLADCFSKQAEHLHAHWCTRDPSLLLLANTHLTLKPQLSQMVHSVFTLLFCAFSLAYYTLPIFLGKTSIQVSCLFCH